LQSSPVACLKQLEDSRPDRAGQGVLTAARPVGAAGGYDSGECGGTGNIGGDRHAAFAALVTSDVSYRSCFAIKPCGMPQTIGRLTPRSRRPRCPDCRETCRSCWRLRQWRMRWDRYIGGDRHAAFAALVTSDVSYRSCFAIKPCGMPQTIGRLTPRSGRPRCPDCRETCRSCWRLRQWRMRWDRYIAVTDTPHSLPSSPRMSPTGTASAHSPVSRLQILRKRVGAQTDARRSDL
jgi:hypothetical protein